MVQVDGKGEDDKPKPKTFLENVDLVFKVLVGVGTLVVGYYAYQLNGEVARTNQEVALNNARITDIAQELDRQRFGQDQINAAYDRVERYLMNEDRKQSHCNAMVYYVNRLPDQDLVKGLMEILGQEAKSLCVQEAATSVVVAGQEPSVPSGIETFRQGFVFAQNSEENSDVRVFACANASNEAETVRVATLVGKAIGDSASFGRVTGSYWREFDGLLPERDSITFVVDEGHPEARKVDELEQIIRAQIPDAEFRQENNRGELTRWMISVIACV